MKPTWNVVSAEGQKTFSVIFDTIGFFTRTTDDLQLIATALGIKDDEKANVPPFKIRGARFAFVKSSAWAEVGPSTNAVLETGIRLLREKGAQIEEVTLPPAFGNLSKWHTVIMCSDGQAAFYNEYLRSKEKLDEQIIEMVENSDGYTRTAQLAAFDGIASLRPQFDLIANQYAAIITPSAVDEAPVGEKTGRAIFNTSWTVRKRRVLP